MVITQSLLHVGELCEGTTGGNGVVGQVLSSGERDGDVRCSGGGWDGWDGLYGRLEEGAGEIYCMNSFTAE